MLTFSSKGKAYLKRLGGKARGKKISSLPGESPSHPLFRLSPTSRLPTLHRFLLLFPSLRLFHPPTLLLTPPFHVRLTLLVQGTTNASQVQWQPPFHATSTCPVSRGSLGRRTPFASLFGEGPQSFLQGRVGWFWQTTANIPQGGVRWFSEGKRDSNAARFA